ncbi:MAG: hypothetical protein ABFD98_15440 [Syntrophobacteraceae bacterium]|nr:hypothetical protein [Desulfobacteraceae bacterium]
MTGIQNVTERAACQGVKRRIIFRLRMGAVPAPSFGSSATPGSRALAGLSPAKRKNDTEDTE